MDLALATQMVVLPFFIFVMRCLGHESTFLICGYSWIHDWSRHNVGAVKIWRIIVGID